MTTPTRWQTEPLELPMLGPLSCPEPADECRACELLALWIPAYRSPGNKHYDPTKATDCVIETRNHPHQPFKLTMPTETPDGKPWKLNTKPAPDGGKRPWLMSSDRGTT
jgi:hypothetical protein